MPTEAEKTNLVQYMSAGTTFTVTFLALLAAGIWADMHFHSLPGFTVLGGGAGFGIALYRLLRTAKRIRRSKESSLPEFPTLDDDY